MNVTTPFALATGTYVNPPRFPTAMSAPAITSAPPYLRVPVAGRVVISTVTSASESTSAYPQSPGVVVKVWVASSAIVAAPPEVVGKS